MVVEAYSSISAGPANAIFGKQQCAIVGRRIHGTAQFSEINRAGAAEGMSRRCRLARRNKLECRPAQEARDRAAQADDLGLLAGGRIAVAGRVSGIEAGFNSVAILGAKQLERKLDGDRVLLPDITHVRRALDRDAGDGHVAAAHGLAAAPLHLGVDVLYRWKRGLGERREPGLDEIAA